MAGEKTSNDIIGEIIRLSKNPEENKKNEDKILEIEHDYFVKICNSSLVINNPELLKIITDEYKKLTTNTILQIKQDRIITSEEIKTFTEEIKKFMEEKEKIGEPNASDIEEILDDIAADQGPINKGSNIEKNKKIEEKEKIKLNIEKLKKVLNKYKLDLDELKKKSGKTKLGLKKFIQFLLGHPKLNKKYKKITEDFIDDYKETTSFLRKNKNKLTNEQIKEINKTLTEINKLPDFKEKYFYIDEKDEKELKNTKEDAQKKIIPESIKDYIQRVNPDFYPNLPSVYEAANKYKISPALLIAVMQNDTKLGKKTIGKNNFGNIGNTDKKMKQGDHPIQFKSPKAGIEAVAKNLKSRIDEFKELDLKRNPMPKELMSGISKEGKRFYGIYMSDPNGKKNVQRIYVQLTGKNYV